MDAPDPVSRSTDQRRDKRYKDSIKGSIDYLGASYLCLVDDISQEGLYLLSGVAADIGDQINVHIQISEEATISCLAEVRHVTSDGLGARIRYISNADAYVFTDRIQNRLDDDLLADAVRRGRLRLRS